MGHPLLQAPDGGCCYLGYFQTLEEDGTKGAGDTTCDHFRIPFACQPIEEGESCALGGAVGAVGELAAAMAMGILTVNLTASTWITIVTIVPKT